MAAILNLFGSLSSLSDLQTEDMKLSQKVELKKEAIEIILFGSFNASTLNLKFKIGSEILGFKDEETDLGSIALEMKPSFINKGFIIFNLASEDKEKFSQYRGVFKEKGFYLVLKSLAEYNSMEKGRKIDKHYLDQHLIQFFLGLIISYRSDQKAFLIPFDTLLKFDQLKKLLTINGFKLYKNQKKYCYVRRKEEVEKFLKKGLSF